MVHLKIVQLSLCLGPALATLTDSILLCTGLGAGNRQQSAACWQSV